MSNTEYDFESSPPMVYRSCRTCGRYMELPADSKRVYCSPECARRWRACVVCGRWYVVEEGSDEYCSEECRQPPRAPGGIVDWPNEE